MENTAKKNCSHPEGLWSVTSTEYQCPVCRARLGVEEIERWVRDAERQRDEAYIAAEGGARGAGAKRLREVYRRRRVLYELRNTPRGEAPSPEMILVTYDAAGDAYECRIFYKEPRPTRGPGRVSIEAELDHILTMRSHPDPNIRLASGKVEEFHALRERLMAKSVPPPPRRVYYSSEL